MLQKILILSLAILSVFNCTSAAARATISGRILDQDSGKPVQHAALSARSVNDEVIRAATVANNEGYFVLSGLEPGEYRIDISSIGYVSQKASMFIGVNNDSYNAGDIKLRTDTTLLEEVVVTGQASTIATLANREYSLSENIAQANGSLLDAMKNLPGITITQEGRVLLRGSDKVTILIDGKPSAITGYGDQKGLDSLPASSAESIQIINNPSARYDAAGMAGIINIVTRKDRTQGLSGDIGLTLSVGQLTRAKEDLPTEMGSYKNNRKANPSLNLNHATDNSRSHLYLEYMAQNDLPNNEYASRYYDNGDIILSQVPENRVQTQYIIKAGNDWTQRSGRTLSINGIYNFETHTDRAQVPFINANTNIQNRYWFWREREDTGLSSFSANYKIPFTQPGHELDLRVEYSRVWEDEAYYLNEISTIRTGTDNTHIVAKEKTLPITIDYVRPTSTGRIEAGVKYQNRSIPVTYDVERGNNTVIYPGLGDWSDWNEKIYSGYTNYIHETRNVDIEAGLRLEQTDVAYKIPEENIYYPKKNDAYDYFELFPNFKATWSLTSNNKLLLSYNRRIDRSGEPELRIFPKYDDPELLKVGNPYLRPQFTKVYETGFEHSWDRGSASLSTYLRDITNPYLRVYAIDSTDPDYDVVNKIYQNVSKSKQTGLELLFSHDLKTDWRLSASFNWYKNEIDAFQTELRFPTVRPFSINASSSHTWDMKISNQIKLLGSLQAQLSYVYYADRNVPQGIEYARSSVDLGIKRPILKSSELTFTVSDLFNDFGLRQRIVSQGVTTVYENLFESQVVSLGIKTRF